MTRTIGITFEDGSDHIFENVPDDTTPEQVEERVRTQFPDKKIYNMDGQGQLIHWYNDPRTEQKQPTAGEMLSGAISSAGEGISNIASGIYEAGKQEFADEGERISQAYEQGGVLGAAGQVGQTAVDVALKDIASPLAGFVVDTADAIVGGANLLSDVYSQSSAAQDLPRLPNGIIDTNSPEYQAFARNYEVPTYQENKVGQYLGSTEGYQQGLEDIGIVSEVDRPVMGLIGTAAPAIATGGAAVAPTIGRVAAGTGRAVVKGAQATGRGAQTVGRVAKEQLTGENLRYRALDVAGTAMGSPVPVGATIQALRSKTVAGALPTAGRVVGGIKGETAGRLAQQALQGGAKQVDEVVPTPVAQAPVATAPVKPTAPAPVASIEESITRSRSVLGESAADDAVNAAAVETRAQGIIVSAKEQGVVIPKKTAQQQAQREIDDVVATQQAEAQAARSAELQARKAVEAERKAAEEAAFLKANAPHIKSVDDAIAKYPSLAERANQRAGMGFANQRDKWIKEPETFKRDLALQEQKPVPAVVKTPTDKQPSTEEILATIRARKSAETQTPVAPVKPTARVETPAQTQSLQRVREGLKRDDQRLADEETLTGMADDMPIAVPEELASVAPVAPTDILAQIRARGAAEQPVAPTRPSPLSPEAQARRPSSLEQVKERLRKQAEEVDASQSVPDQLRSQMLIDKQSTALDNRRAAQQGVQDIKADIKGYIVPQRQGRKNVVNMDILRAYAKDKDLDIDFSDLPDTTGMSFPKARTAITNWMYKKVKDAPKGFKKPQSPFNVLFGE